MAHPRHLTRAPIREAIFDFRVKAEAGLQPEHLSKALPALQKSFPHVEEHRGVEAVITVRPAADAPSHLRDLGLQGYLLRSADGLTAVQLRVDGFTFNRLAPYTSWEQLLPVVIAAWSEYRIVARPEFVARVGARYINHIPLPEGVQQLNEYLTIGPALPSEYPQFISGYVTQLVLHEPATQLTAAVRQALESNAALRQITLVMDIDAYRAGQLDPGSSELEVILGKLRELKNRIFFASLTERTVKLFE